MPYIQKEDRREYQKLWYEKNKNKSLLSANKRYYAKRQEILAKRRILRQSEAPEKREKRLSYLIEYRKTHQPEMRYNNQTFKSKFRQYIFSAGRRNHEFNLSFETFVELFNSGCAYCGCENARGIDRIDNEVGYTKDNSVPCCKVCNKMKIHYSKEFFIEHIAKIYQFNNKIK